MGQDKARGARTVSAPLALTLPPEALEQIAQRAAELVAEQAAAVPSSPYLTVDETAEYLRCSSKQRVYDLVHARALAPVRDGRRLLFHRDHLDAYLRGATA
jgi:excisionase family DNA binding protein